MLIRNAWYFAGFSTEIETRLVNRFPNLPTLIESGLPDYEMGSWYGLLAPAGISGELRSKLHGDTVRILALSDVKAKMAGINFEVMASSPELFAAHIRT